MQDDGNISIKTERQILETILKIRNKDGSIYDPAAKFYSDDDDEDEDDDKKKKDSSRENKPMYLKDMVYQEALERAQTNGDDSDSDGPRDVGKTYVEEQEDLKKAFLDAYDEEVGGELEEKNGFGGVLEKSHVTRKEAEIDDEETQKLVDSIFAKDASMTSNDKFLRDYILKQAWMKDSDDDEFEEEEQVDEDEEAYEAAEDFEANYNFRFEEPGGAEIATHPRIIEGIVRKKDDRRKQKRAEKAARKAQEEEERRKELKQLKNLKKMEIEDKLSEIQTIAGNGVAEEDLIGKLLDGEFDPEEHDKAMAEAFGDEYYNQEEEEDDLEDEEFDKKLAAMAEYSSDEEAENTISAMLQKKQKEGEEEDPSDSKKTAKEDVKKLLDEYYKLDYEDYVGGIPTRFKYKQVEPETYGLSFEEILMMDDKELNQVMGMKRVAAPYHDGPKRRPNYGKLHEMRKSKEEYSAQKKQRRNHNAGFSILPETREEEEPANDPRSAEQKETDRRLDTFKKPKLHKRKSDASKQQHDQNHENHQKKKKKTDQQPAPNPAIPPGLTKAQKKNLKRSMKRAQKHAA